MRPEPATSRTTSGSRGAVSTTDSRALRRRARSQDFAKAVAKEERHSWQQHVLYHHRVRTALSNERAFIGWLRLGIALVSLGFVVERLDLFLARMQGGSPPPVTSLMTWAPLAIYGMGSGTLVIATSKFFIDKARIESEAPLHRRTIVGLVLIALATMVLIALLLGVPELRELPR